jgi:protein-L-isoaspartate(D-aspartate) O-methyltransferase
MGAVPREAFVPTELATEAYADRPLPIGAGQTISQPYMVAFMAEAARIGPGDRVLEIGAGCGYEAAVLSRLAAEVHAVERLPDLARDARRRLADLGCIGASVHLRDGTEGLPEVAPFDAVIVSAGGERVPPALKQELAEGGRLVVPVGAPGTQALLRLVRHGDEFDE